MAESPIPPAPHPQGNPLPPRPNLEHLKNQAKRRLDELRRHDPAARLAHAQYAIARKYGFTSWRALKAHVEAGPTHEPQPPGEPIVRAFFEAIRRNDADELRRMLHDQPSLALAVSADGASPLHESFSLPATLELLVEHGANLNARYGRVGHTPLSWAVTVNAMEQASTLVRLGADVDLFCAAGLGLLDKVRRCFDDAGELIPGSSRTGSSRFAPDGSRLPCPPDNPREIVSDALYIAARLGQVEVARELLRHHPDLNFRAYIGATPLHWAWFSGSMELVALLREAGADETLRDDDFKSTPRAFGICCAAGWGLLNLVRKHLARDPSLVNLRDGRGTALWEAARSGEKAVVEALLAAGAEPAVICHNGQTAQQIAAARGHAEIAALLQRDPLSLASKAANEGDLDAITRILDAHPDQAESWTGKLLHQVCWDHRLNVLDLLLNRGVDPDVRGGDNATPLQIAATYGQLAAVKRLVKAGADVNAEGDDHGMGVIGWATCFSMQREVADFLIEQGAKVHIFAAIALDRPDLVRRIVQADPSQLERPMSVFEDRRRPLHHAVGKNKAAVVKLLLQLGADRSAKDAKGLIPLAMLQGPAEPWMRAALTPVEIETLSFFEILAAERFDRAEQLLHDQPDRLQPGATDHQAIYRAAEQGMTMVVRWLAARGADVNTRTIDDCRQTALHAAAHDDKLETLAALLHLGADPLLRDERWNATAAEWAGFYRQTKAHAFLREAVNRSGGDQSAL